MTGAAPEQGVWPGPPWLSLVVPLRNEAENVAFLTEAIAGVADRLGAFELVYVDDGSADATAARVAEAAARFPFVRLVAHAAPAGQSAAIHSGVLLARGAAICTRDGDGQNPPAEIPRLLAGLDGHAFPSGVGLIAGQRVARRDSVWKRLGSRIANGIRSWMLRDGTRDTGCGLKLFRRDAFLALPYFDHMHRFLPALFARDGWGVVRVDVAHAPRHAGRSNYGNLARAAVGVHDLLGVAWLIRRRKKVRPQERELRT
jgi:dolichol-phosphate mannosyltransferase